MAAQVLYGHGLKLAVIREELADPIQKERLR